MGSFCFLLGCSNLKQNFSPAKFLKFKFLPLVKDYSGKKYPILSDRYVMLVWVAFLAKKSSLKPGVKVGRKGQDYVILYIIPNFKFLLYQFLKKKSVKSGSSKILLAAHTYSSVEVIILGMIIETKIMVNAFNNYVRFYVVSRYGC